MIKNEKNRNLLIKILLILQNQNLIINYTENDYRRYLYE